MKKIQILFFATLFVFSSIISEVQSQDLVDISFFQSQDLRKKLGLSFEQTHKMESTLLYFGEKYKKLMAEEYDEKQSFQVKYELLKQERETEMKEFLSPRQIELFNAYHDQRIQYFKDFYESTQMTLSKEPELANELAAYNHNVMLPELLRYRAQLDEEITIEDSIKLVEYSKQFNEILDDILADENLAQFTGAEDINKSLKKYSRKDPENKKNFKGIQRMLKEYQIPLNDISLEIDPMEIKWRNDITTIVNKYLPEEEQEAFSNTMGLLGAYGISHKIDPLVFLLFDPADDKSYFQLKRKLYRIYFRDMM